MVAELILRVAGFGPLQPYLDPTVEMVWINEPARVFVAREGRHDLPRRSKTSGSHVALQRGQDPCSVS